MVTEDAFIYRDWLTYLLLMKCPRIGLNRFCASSPWILKSVSWV